MVSLKKKLKVFISFALQQKRASLGESTCSKDMLKYFVKCEVLSSFWRDWNLHSTEDAIVAVPWNEVQDRTDRSINYSKHKP